MTRAGFALLLPCPPVLFGAGISARYRRWSRSLLSYYAACPGAPRRDGKNASLSFSTSR